ncbi:ferritin-like domain-containing protein [Actinomycetospora sp. CA-101289]|uniref:ferritin-like domain-containing protein n=1 Tax=Actinomycetospora sp. CA-101289 TaxID=3239893 RepID=UPI003D968E0D
MAHDLATMLEKIKNRQWALADVDWAAPGAESVTDEQRPRLRAFMADLVWVENIGARGFAAMATKAEDPTLREIYRWFDAEEQRHANAELALMRRWGMLADDEVPEPNVNVRLAIEWLDRYADGMSLSVLGTVIPMLEVALDGALVKFLLDEVRDPVCHEVFAKINADESRHLAVDFQVLEMLGNAPLRRLLIDSVGALFSPSALLGALMYMPLLNRVRDNVVAMGLPEEQLYRAIRRFASNGDRSDATRRLPMYHVVRAQGSMAVDRAHPYHYAADLLVRVSDLVPRALLPRTPSWARELTHEPVAR